MTKQLPILRGRWYRLHIEGEPPLVGRLVGTRLRDDWPGERTTLSIELRLTIRSSDHLYDEEWDPGERKLTLELADGLVE